MSLINETPTATTTLTNGVVIAEMPDGSIQFVDTNGNKTTIQYRDQAMKKLVTYLLAEVNLPDE